MHILQCGVLFLVEALLLRKKIMFMMLGQCGLRVMDLPSLF